MIDIESSALVERLLNDLLKTSEAYQRTKNESSIITNENKLNQQALVPLQKENERLVHENNELHLDIIKAKEEIEQVDLKWKSSMRQLQNECQDLKFLVDQKDLRIQKQEQELSKLRSKMEKILVKTYMPSQDEVIEGLQAVEVKEHNILKGTQQDFQMTHPLSKQHNDISEVMRDQSFTQERFLNREDIENKNKVWAEEIGKADERCEFFRQQTEDLKKRKIELEERLQQTEKQVYVREEEIKRLQHLYEGGQNLEKLNMRYIQENNEKSVSKLSNQVEFLNKENHKLLQQVDFLRGDRTVVNEIDQLKNEINDLAFENQTLRKDLAECTKILKDYQEKEFRDKQKETFQHENQRQSQEVVEEKLKELSNEHEKLKTEYQKVQSMKSAYNADKQAFINRIEELESLLQMKEREIQDLQNRLKQSEAAILQYKGEINFLNGKCTTLKRDLDYQERYAQKQKEENIKLNEENEIFTQQLNLKDREQNLLRKQVNGLQEDNDRINRMYQVVEREAYSGKPNIQEQQMQKENDQERIKPSKNQKEDKWQTVDDNFASTGTFGKQEEFKKLDPDMKTTVKRSSYI